MTSERLKNIISIFHVLATRLSSFSIRWLHRSVTKNIFQFRHLIAPKCKDKKKWMASAKRIRMRKLVISIAIRAYRCSASKAQTAQMASNSLVKCYDNFKREKRAERKLRRFACSVVSWQTNTRSIHKFARIALICAQILTLILKLILYRVNLLFSLRLHKKYTALYLKGIFWLATLLHRKTLLTFIKPRSSSTY